LHGTNRKGLILVWLYRVWCLQCCLHFFDQKIQPLKALNIYLSAKLRLFSESFDDINTEKNSKIQYRELIKTCLNLAFAVFENENQSGIFAEEVIGA